MTAPVCWDPGGPVRLRRGEALRGDEMRHVVRHRHRPAAVVAAPSSLLHHLPAALTMTATIGTVALAAVTSAVADTRNHVLRTATEATAFEDHCSPRIHATNPCQPRLGCSETEWRRTCAIALASAESSPNGRPAIGGTGKGLASRSKPPCGGISGRTCPTSLRRAGVPVSLAERPSAQDGRCSGGWSASAALTRERPKDDIT